MDTPDIAPVAPLPRGESASPPADSLTPEEVAKLRDIIAVFDQLAPIVAMLNPAALAQMMSNPSVAQRIVMRQFT